jgi:hypothetical protein
MRWSRFLIDATRFLGLATGLVSAILMLVIIIMEGLSPGGSILVSEPNPMVRSIELVLLVVAISGLVSVIWYHARASPVFAR